MIFRHASATLLPLLLSLGAPVQAADVVTDAMVAAYAPYRAALFRTNSGAQAESQQAIDKARQSWQAVTDKFGAQAPAPYDRDAQFGATAAQVSAVYERAADEIAAGRLPQAHETLEQARDLIAAIRHRNGVIVFSDHMNAYHAEMEHLLIDGPKILAGPQGLARVTAQVGVLDYLARQLRAQAPASLTGDVEFLALLQGVQASVSALMSAALTGDEPALKQAIGSLKKPYSKMFLKYG